MIKKIFFILFILFIAILVSYILSFDGGVVVNLLDYEITTDVGFLLFLFVAFFFSLYLFVYIVSSLFYPNVNKYKKKEKKLRENIFKYIDFITESLVYKNIQNTKMARKKLKIANKLFKNSNLSNFVESQIYYIEKDYDRSEEEFKKINISTLDSNLLSLKASLERAKEGNNFNNIEKIAISILKIEPFDVGSLKVLYKIYKKANNWSRALDILNVIAETKIFDQDGLKEEYIFIYTALGKKYFDNAEYFEAKKYLRNAYEMDRYYLPSVTLLIETYIKLNKSYKAISVIKKTWKHVTSAKLADLYYSLYSEKARNDIKVSQSLYKLNTKSFYSNFIMANAYFENGLYNKARKYSKEAGNVGESKELYEIMLKIEQNDEGSSAIMTNLRKKIASVKNIGYKCRICNQEYYDWQPKCPNCIWLNTIK